MSGLKPLSEVLKGQMKTRENPCGLEGCTTLHEQTYFLNMWTPEHCAPCMHKMREARQMSKEERTRVEREQAGKTALLNLRVPALYRSVTLESFELHGEPKDKHDQEVALAYMAGFLEAWPDVGPERQILTFRGGVGTGKGHVAWSVAKRVAEDHGAVAHFIRLPDLIREIRGTWRDKTDTTEAEVLDRHRRKDLLVIDEVSRHAFYGQGFQHLLDVIDHRVNNQKPTILTTNDNDGSLEEILGPAMWSRINGCGGILEFGNDDWRSRERGAEAA
jgi:DNA replication protein DnaC